MRQVWIAIAAVFAGGVVFVVSWVAAFLIGVEATVHSECDGVCFQKLDEVGYVAFGVGGLCGVAAAYYTWRFISNRVSTRT